MHNWTNFCNIIKFNLKSKSLVAHVATGLFLNDEAIKNLHGKKTFVVPPDIDTSREIELGDIKIIDELKFEFTSKFDSASVDELVGKSLLISTEDAKEVFGDLLFENDNKLIGKTVIDSKQGKIGEVKDVAGTSAQKHLIIDCNGDEVLIPFVNEFVKEEKENEILMKLPAGIIEVNKA